MVSRSNISAWALPYKGTIAPSLDDAWVFIQNATPLSSVTVVDHKAWKVTAEVPTLGCWIIPGKVAT